MPLDNSGNSPEECQKCFAAREKFLSGCKTVPVHQYGDIDAYPPPKHWMVESSDIGDKWHAYCTTRHLADKREGYHPMCTVDEKKLDYVVKENESVLLVDDRTGELVGCVIREWCPEQGVVDAIAEYIRTTPSLKRSARVRMWKTMHKNASDMGLL